MPVATAAVIAFGGLALDDEVESYVTLVSASSSTGLAYVDLGAPTDSYLYMKVSADPRISGEAMPPPDGMSAAESEEILAWIEQGARP